MVSIQLHRVKRRVLVWIVRFKENTYSRLTGHTQIKLPLKILLGSLNESYTIDLIKIEMIKSPKCPNTNQTFGVSNCS